LIDLPRASRDHSVARMLQHPREMTVLEVLTAATGYLKDHGVEHPRLNAEHLLAHVLRKKRLDLYLEFDRSLSEAERAPFRRLIRDRATRKPLQHLLGTAEFFGRSFLSDERALVPRPETEQLVELVIKHFLSGPEDMRILDVGTGSGVIAITLALELPRTAVWATDVSLEALSLARENAARHSVRVNFYQANLFPAAADRFDCIVANLPYIISDELAGLQREVQHDPPAALDGGPDGLCHIRRLIESAPEHLTPSGSLALELGEGQAEVLSSELTALGYEEVRTWKDYQGIERFTIASPPQKE
jgi:release factor glutamine methyltransferase